MGNRFVPEINLFPHYIARRLPRTTHLLLYRNMREYYLRSPTWTELGDSCPKVFARKSDFRPFDQSSDCLWTHSRRNLATAVVRAAKAVVGIFVST